MLFEIPDVGSLNRYTVAALRDLGLEASAEFEQMRSDISPDTVTDEQLDRMQALQDFCLAADTEIAARDERQNRFASLTAEPEPTPATTATPVAVATTTATPAASTTTASGVTATTTFATTVAVVDGDDAPPTLAQVAPGSPALEGEVLPTAKPFTFIAAPDTGFAAGSELDDWAAVAQAFTNRTRTYGASPAAQQHSVAQIQREFGEFNILVSDNDESTMTKINRVRDERRLEGGSLLAGVGWCAPSEVIYTTCTQVTTDGMLSLPEIGARRGGIRHNTGLDFSTVFGDGTGFNIKTEAQVIADSAKTCVAIPCPTFVDDRLKVAVLCITGDILQDRGYSEFVSDFIQASIAVQGHNVNRQIIADIVTGSTAVTMSTEPFISDGSVVSQVMSAVEVATIDIRYRLRLRMDATIEIVLPMWLQGQMRADWLRRNAAQDPNMVDSMIADMFRARGAHVQYVYDWQDAFSSVAGNPGDATPLTNLPVTVKFLAYPAGTWVVARQDVIRLDAIYDSTNITTNKVTQLFLEDGFRAMQFCPLSRVYTIPNICPSGQTGAQASVDCTTP